MTTVRKLVFACVPAIFAYALAEVVFLGGGFWLSSEDRLTRQNYSDFLEESETLGYRPRPNLRGFVQTRPKARVWGTFDTDEEGFRNAEVAREGRTVYVGDSFTAGVWVPREKTFFGRLDGISLACPGYGIPQYEVLVAQQPASAHVVVCVFANDLTPWYSMSYELAWFRRARDEAKVMPPLWTRSLTHWLGHSVQPRPEWERRFAQDGTALMSGRGACLEYFSGRHDRDVEAAMRRILARPNTDLALLPSTESAHVAEFARLWPGRQEVAIEERGYAKLAEIARGMGRREVDMTKAFRASPEGRYLAIDGHFSETGHELAARCLRP